jgi:hypothetical protein
MCVVSGAPLSLLRRSGDAGRGVCVASLCGHNFGLPPTSFQSFSGVYRASQKGPKIIIFVTCQCFCPETFDLIIQSY